MRAGLHIVTPNKKFGAGRWACEHDHQNVSETMFSKLFSASYWDKKPDAYIRPSPVPLDTFALAKHECIISALTIITSIQDCNAALVSHATLQAPSQGTTSCGNLPGQPAGALCTRYAALCPGIM
jgi:hypothetical protein